MRYLVLAASLGAALVVAGCSPLTPITELGAVDDAYRRGAGGDGRNIYDPLDLPGPNARRLGSGVPGPDYWQQRCDYVIDCELDADTKRLTADMRVVYSNNSPHDLGYVWFQLEQNLFRTDSTGTKSRGRGVMKPLAEDFDGGYDIGYLRAGGDDLEYAVHDTLMRVELEEPLEPGEQIAFQLGFAFDMPPHLRRMGSEDVEQGRIFEYAQWFPHVCNYDDVNGWNTLPYIGTGEFYTNFGDYEVNITVPRSHIVAATGELQNPEEVLTETQLERLSEAIESDETVVIVFPDEVGTRESRPAGGGKLTWQYKAENVRTFAWASSDAFIWDACGADVTDLEGDTRRVLCQSLYPKEAESWYWNDDSRGSTQVIKHSIEYYSEWLYPYPLPVMSNINGPEGGMEYPGIIFCGARTNDRGMVGVTDHEVGHNWYPMIVNTDERRYMWQDEGFNSFIGLYSVAAWYEREPDIDNALRRTVQIMDSENRQRIALAPDKHWPRWVGTLNYRKTALALYLLREVVLGPERFDRAFIRYTHEWAYKHPQPSDFYRVMEDAAGADLAWFWRGWLLSDGVLDIGVELVAVDEGSVVIDLVNHGDMVMPVPLRVTFEDGTSEDHTMPHEIWSATDRWRTRLKTESESPVRSIMVDPEGVYPEVDKANNEALVAP